MKAAEASGMTLAEFEAQRSGKGITIVQYDHSGTALPANAKKGYSWGTEKKAKELKSDAPAPG